MLLYHSHPFSCLNSQVSVAAVLAGDVPIIMDFGGVQRKNELLTLIWNAVYLKEYIIIFNTNPDWWTASLRLN